MARFSDGGFRDWGGSTQSFVTVAGGEGVCGEETGGIYSCRVRAVVAMDDAALLYVGIFRRTPGWFMARY